MKLTAAMKIALWILLPPSALAAEFYTTNRITADTDFREVDGKLYNVKKSVRWELVEGVRIEDRSPTETLAREFTIQQHGHRESLPYNSLGRIGGFSGPTAPLPFIVDWEETNWGTFFILKNFTGAGEKIRDRALYIGTTNYQQRQIRVLDCGVPHVVTIVKTNKIPSGK